MESTCGGSLGGESGKLPLSNQLRDGGRNTPKWASLVAQTVKNLPAMQET